MSFSVRINGQIIGPLAYQDILTRAPGWQKLKISVEVAPAGTQAYQTLTAFLNTGACPCPGCGAHNALGSRRCGNCGRALVPQANIQHGVSKTKTLLAWLASILGPPIRTIEGVVVHAEAPYSAKPDWVWRTFLFKAAVLIVATIFLGPLFLGIILGVWIFILLWATLFPRAGVQGQGFFSSVFGHLFSYFLADRLLRRRSEVPVRDVRVKDSCGQQWLVRMKGDLIGGSVTTGDEIVAEGHDYRGTLLLISGWNKTINSAIVVKKS